METPTVYLTKEQIGRLAGLSQDALIGCQLHTDASDQTGVSVDMVSIDSPYESEHYWINADGSYTCTT